MIIKVCIEIINVPSMSHRCLLIEQACFYDNINESSMLPMWHGLEQSNPNYLVWKKEGHDPESN